MRRGFSLLELTFVLVFAGLISGLVLHVRQNNVGGVAGDCATTTKIQMTDIQAAMDRYVRSNSKYPMPAKRALGVESTGFGREAAIADVNQDAGATVYYGALPFQTLGLAPSYAGDCWGNKFTYVVTQMLTTTTAATFSLPVNVGRITLNNQTATAIASNIAYAVISHGADGEGASKLNAASAGFCTPSGKLQTENCDNGNAILMTAPFNNGANAGNAFYDDLIVYAGKAGTVAAGTTNGIGGGENDNGQAGNGPPFAANTLPAAINSTLEFKSIGGGGKHACGIAMSNDVYCWGRNSDGQLGDGGTVGPRSNPVIVAGAVTQFKQLALGDNHSCGIATDDKIYCWGDDSLGQVGNDAVYVDVSTPTAIAAIAGFPAMTFTQIDAKERRTCAIGTNGVTYCWGNDIDGGVGNGAPLSQEPTPQPVTGANIFTKITVGGFHSCAINAAGITYCWGRNDEGQLATTPAPFTADNPNPILSNELIKKAYTFVDLAAGFSHTCGLTELGKAICWGDNSSGQLGDPAAVSGSIAEVVGGHTFTKLVAGYNHTCGLVKFPVANEGEVYCWGSNINEQLGQTIGAIGASSATPVLVPSTDTSPAYDIGAGAHTTYIIRAIAALPVGTLPTAVPPASSNCINGACGYPNTIPGFTCLTPCAQATATTNQCIGVPSNTAASDQCQIISPATAVMNCTTVAPSGPFTVANTQCPAFLTAPPATCPAYIWDQVAGTSTASTVASGVTYYTSVGGQDFTDLNGASVNTLSTMAPYSVTSKVCGSVATINISCQQTSGPINFNARIGTGEVTCGAPPPATCPLPWGGTIANGTNVTAYSAMYGPSVAVCETAGSSKETRTCLAGSLNGTFTFPAQAGVWTWNGTTWDTLTATCAMPAFPGSVVGEQLFCCGEIGVPPIVNGACGAASNTCTAGTPISFVAGSCPGTDTWTCQGSGGGTNDTTCNAPRTGCAPCNVPGLGIRPDGSTFWSRIDGTYGNLTSSRCKWSSGWWTGNGDQVTCNNGSLDSDGAPWACTGAGPNNWVYL